MRANIYTRQFDISNEKSDGCVQSQIINLRIFVDKHNETNENEKKKLFLVNAKIFAILKFR